MIISNEIPVTPFTARCLAIQEASDGSPQLSRVTIHYHTPYTNDTSL